MEFSCEFTDQFTQASFNSAVNILVRLDEDKRACLRLLRDRRETTQDRVGIARRDDSHRPEHPCVSERTSDINTEQSSIRRIHRETPECTRRVILESPTRPETHRGDPLDRKRQTRTAAGTSSPSEVGRPISVI